MLRYHAAVSSAMRILAQKQVHSAFWSMLREDLDRRDFLAALVGGTTAGFVRIHWNEIRAAAGLAAQAPQGAPYQVLTTEQVRELDAFTSTLIPTDETPGAREAHVVRFIDNALATFWKERRPGLEGAMTQIAAAVEKRTPGNKSFAALSETDRIAVVEDLQKNNHRVFGPLRNATMVGMFSHPDHGGNFGKVGWKLIGFDDRHSWVAPFGYYDRT